MVGKRIINMSNHQITITIDEELVENAIVYEGDESYRLHLADAVIEEYRRKML